MSDLSKQFKVVIPAELSKGKDGDWIVKGLASTPSKDQQGEILLPEGIDASPIDQGRGVLNWDHQKGPENTLGLLDKYSISKGGFYVEGRLFKNHKKAQSVQEIMSSLGKSDKGRMGLSVEGKILERAGKDGKIIKKCQISAVALTMNPVNQDSFVDLVKSMVAAEMDFQATEENVNSTAIEGDAPIFTAKQVLSLMEKALGISGAAASNPPSALSGGDALGKEDLDKKPAKVEEESKEEKKPLKKLSKEMYKSQMIEMIEKLSLLYPNNSKAAIWTAVKDRMEKKFPQLNENED